MRTCCIYYQPWVQVRAREVTDSKQKSTVTISTERRVQGQKYCPTLTCFSHHVPQSPNISATCRPRPGEASAGPALSSYTPSTRSAPSPPSPALARKDRIRIQRAPVGSSSIQSQNQPPWRGIVDFLKLSSKLGNVRGEGGAVNIYTGTISIHENACSPPERLRYSLKKKRMHLRIIEVGRVPSLFFPPVQRAVWGRPSPAVSLRFCPK